MRYWGYAPYVSVAEKKEKAARKLKQLKKKNPNMKPVLLEGHTIARTWWGKAWNVNLERYADYSNRIGRGRSYVRNGAVLDLQIKPGEVTALIQGTARNPYTVIIEIKRLSTATWKDIRRACEGQLDSLQELLMGEFPKTLGELFTAKGKGLFPAPKEIEFSCSCPDWAYMCKHVAATLYGISARLDEDPGLFFRLRKIDVGDLISQAVEAKSQQLLGVAEKKSENVLEDAGLSELFGIDLETDVEFPNPGISPSAQSSVRKRVPQSPARKKQTRHKRGKPTLETPRKRPKGSVTEAPARKPAKARAAQSVDNSGLNPAAIDVVAAVIRKSRKGVDVTTLMRKTGLDEKKIRNILYRLKKQGKIKNVSRGIYVSRVPGAGYQRKSRR